MFSELDVLAGDSDTLLPLPEVQLRSHVAAQLAGSEVKSEAKCPFAIGRKADTNESVLHTENADVSPISLSTYLVAVAAVVAAVVVAVVH
jgi:hypothetical protein